MQLYLVDAFSQALFGGNPAGVVLTEKPLSERYMRSLAAEIRYSETAFVVYDSQGAFDIRYFTPQCEVALCGHATIAAFTALRHAGLARAGHTYKAGTEAGMLEVDVLENSVWMDTAAPCVAGKLTTGDLKRLYGAFSISADTMPAGLFPEIISTGLPDIMLAVDSRETLNALKPDMRAISELSIAHSVVGIHVFSPGGDGVKAYCRNFAPVYGIDEEAATGTSNGALTYYLYRHGRLALGEESLFVQGEAMQRPSSVLTKLVTRDKTAMARVGGGGAIISYGELLGE